MDETRWLKTSYVVSTIQAYKFITLLSKDYEEWPAYELGLIDKDGKNIKEAKSKEEKDAWNKWHILIRSIRNILLDQPYNDQKMLTKNYWMALALIKDIRAADSSIKRESIEEYFHSFFPKDMDSLLEENALLYRGTRIINNGLMETENGVYRIKDSMVPKFTIKGMNIYELFNMITMEYDYVIESDIIENTTVSTGVASTPAQPISKKKKVIKRNDPLTKKEYDDYGNNPII